MTTTANSGRISGGRPRGLKPWPKGQSGNPAGRPKVDLEFRAWCREIMEREGRDALLALAQTAKDEKVRLGAWRFLAEMGHGKPAQQITDDSARTVKVVYVDDWRDRHLRAAQGGG